MDNASIDKGRILIVDDTPANLRLLVDLLVRNGYVAHPATGAEPALRFLETTQPDLILLDVTMPDIDGYQMCERLKADPATREIPVIFISAADQALDKVKAFGSGGVDYIVKPFQSEEVLLRIATHLSLHKLQMRLEALVEERTAALIETNRLLREEVRERRDAEERIRYLAHHDALTGLPNRTLLEDRVKLAIMQLRRTPEQQMALLFLDLDHFKHINDSLGHSVGDRLLQAVAIRLHACLREGDSVARLGGDEFLMVHPLCDSSRAADIAQRVLDELKPPFMVDGHELEAGVSIGISLYPADGADTESLMRAADAAMYHAKDKGRGNYQFFIPALNAVSQQRLAVVTQLRRAIANNEFLVYFQPQVDLASGRIFSAEALLRWKPPGMEVISGGSFIAIAEETGLIVPIGEWVLRQACLQVRCWRDEGHADMRVAVNLSARQCCQPRLPQIVAQILAETGVPAEALDLEITESILMDPSEENIAILRQLHAMGVQLSIDDFGMGYSSLTYLRRFPISVLKIDRVFVSGIGRDVNDTAIITAILALAQSLRLEVIAEGVETREQLDFLRERGCPAVQGYYYSPAVPAEALSGRLGREAEAAAG